MGGIPLGMMASSHQFATGATFEPDDLASVIAWWDASDSSTITTQTANSVEQVLTWTDKIDAVTLTSTGSGTEQGRGIVYNSTQGRVNFQFDDSITKAKIRNTSTRLGLSANPDIIIIECLSPNTVSSGGRQLTIGTENGDYILNNQTDISWRFNNGNRVFNENFSVDTLAICAWNRNSGTNYGASYGFLNGTQMTNSSSASSTRKPSNTAARIGFSTAFDDVGDGEAHAKVHDIIVASADTSSLRTEVRQKVEGYLAHKHSITSVLPSDHPYKTTPPTP